MKISDIYSFTELNDQLRDLTEKLLNAVNDLRAAGRKWAEAENNYRRAKSVAYLNAEGTIPEKHAKVDRACDSERLEAHIAEADREACREYVHALRATLSAYQTLARTNQAEAELAGMPQPQWR